MPTLEIKSSRGPGAALSARAGGTSSLPGSREFSKPTLQREAFTISRQLEYFTEKELRLQIGTDPEVWPLALTKELIDNALDATEAAGIAPIIEVTLDKDGVTVGDNGPGLPEHIIEQSLDYMVRVSDKLHYISPTRGQLGNALKCVWSAPFVRNGKQGQVTVGTGGKRYHIIVALDAISQRLKIEPVVTPCPEVKKGTIVKTWWGDGWQQAGSEDSFGSDCFYNLNITDTAGLLVGYALFNPHATFVLRDKIAGTDKTWRATATTFDKWMPSSPTSPHWYTVEQIEGLIGAYIGVERDGGRARTVREFVSEFSGLSGSQKQKAVTDAAGFTGMSLSAMVNGHGLDRDKTAKLLDTMKRESRAVKAAALGVIGEEHFRRSLRAMGASEESIRYVRKKCDEAPYVIEVGFGVKNTEESRTIITGVNFTPTLATPANEISTALSELRVDRHDPVIVAVHIAKPEARFTGRSKGHLEL
jgi:DNA topoisomerase VI subunit B